MRVIVINDTTQEFDGTRYYLCGLYFQRKGKRLHRAVWEYHNGQIPKGAHVHHILHDRSNNQIENLALRPTKQHCSHHAKQHDKTNWAKAMHQGAAAWHGSPEGIEWHRQHYEKHSGAALQRARDRERSIERFCQQCGKSFTAAHRTARFCSRKCNEKWRRDNGLYDVQRICVVCGVAFTTNKHQMAKTCSPACAGKMQAATKRARNKNRANGDR